MDSFWIFWIQTIYAQRFQEEIAKKIGKIRKRKVIRDVEERILNENSSFDLKYEACKFSIHIIICILMVYFQFNFSLRNRIHAFNEDYLKENFFSFLDDPTLKEQDSFTEIFPYNFFFLYFLFLLLLLYTPFYMPNILFIFYYF